MIRKMIECWLVCLYLTDLRGKEQQSSGAHVLSVLLHISNQTAEWKIFHHQFCAESTCEEFKSKDYWLFIGVLHIFHSYFVFFCFLGLKKMSVNFLPFSIFLQTFSYRMRADWKLIGYHKK